MKPAQPIHIVGFGAVTPVGGTGWVSTAAVRAQLSGLKMAGEVEVDEDADPEEATRPAHVGRVQPSVPETAADDLKRAEAQLTQALTECLGGLGPARVARERLIAYVVARDFPSKTDPWTALIKKAAAPLFDVTAVHRSKTGHAGGLLALDLAMTALEKGEAQLALVAGVDARTSDEALDALVAEGRLLVLGRSFGFVPGEAAACLLVATERVRAGYKLPSLGRVLAAGIGKEKNLPGGDPNLGQGLTEALRGALHGVPGDARVGSIYCDLNGERHRADEWGFSVPRVLDRLAAAEAFVTPTPCTGDVGAASGPLLIGMAIADGLRGVSPGPHALVWSSSDGGERGAVVLQVGPANLTLAQRARPAGRAFEPIDANMLGTMLDEAQFLYAHRLGLIRKLEQDPLLGWTRVGEIEARLRAMIDGVIAGGALGKELGGGILAEGTSGGIYTGICVLAAFDQWPTIWQHLAAVAADDAEAIAEAALAVSTLLGGPAPPPKAAEILSQAWSVDPLLVPVLLEVHASLGKPVPAGVTTAFAAAASGPAIGTAARVLGRLFATGSTAIDPHWFPRWCEACDLEVRSDVVRAWWRVDPKGARAAAVARIDEPWALPLLCVAGDEIAGARLKAELGNAKTEGAESLLLGLWGDPVAVPVLLSRLDDHPDAESAALALELITGASLIVDHILETRLPDDELSDAEVKARADGDPNAGVEREGIKRIDRSRRNWAAFWQANSGRYRAGAPFRAGQPAGVAATVAALRSESLPPSVRAHLEDELLLRHKARTTFTPTQPVEMQLRCLGDLVARN